MELLGHDAIRTLLLFIPPFILSLSFHEFAHAWTADRLGDSTARYLGRLTIDPLAHISWIGTVIFPALSVLTGAPLFGWANPVPVDSRNFRNPRGHMAIVAAAGPASNILMATLFTAILSLLVHNVGGAVAPKGTAGMIGASIEMLVMAVQLNLFLAFFNLIPLPPLDGSRIVQGFVSRRAAAWLDEHSQQAQILLLILFFTGFMRVLGMPVYLFMDFLFRLFGVPI